MKDAQVHDLWGAVLSRRATLGVAPALAAAPPTGHVVLLGDSVVATPSTKSIRAARQKSSTSGAQNWLSARMRISTRGQWPRIFGCRLDRLRQLVQDVGRLVHRAALMPGRGPDLLERLPEAERPVAGGQFRGDRQATCLEVGQQLPPALHALAQADLEADQ